MHAKNVQTYVGKGLSQKKGFSQIMADTLCSAFARKEIASAETSVYPKHQFHKRW